MRRRAVGHACQSYVRQGHESGRWIVDSVCATVTATPPPPHRKPDDEKRGQDLADGAQSARQGPVGSTGQVARDGHGGGPQRAAEDVGDGEPGSAEPAHPRQARHEGAQCGDPATQRDGRGAPPLEQRERTADIVGPDEALR